MLPSAFIFDLDDLLIRSAPIWLSAETRLLNTLGHDWDPDLAGGYKGMNALDVAAAIHRAIKPDLPLEKCQTILRDALIAGFHAGVEPMPGAVALVRRLHAQASRAPLALASGSPPPAITAALDQVSIRNCFDQIISSESVPRGKPHPDVFLAAARALGVPPEKCLVFEDSLVGVQAARAAAMKCFAVLPDAPADIRQLATRTFPSLAHISDTDLQI